MNIKTPLKILVVDNYDSFTYNLVHLLEFINGESPDVIKNDAIDLNMVGNYDAIVLSPGPGIPKEAGKMPELLRKYALQKPILGVCLGLQAITEYFGGAIYNSQKVYHGIATPIYHYQNNILFKGVSSPFMAGRYHSWMAVEQSLPDCLNITAKDDEDHIMALQHKSLNIHGVQFHPESIMTPDGKIIIANWLRQVQ